MKLLARRLFPILTVIALLSVFHIPTQASASTIYNENFSGTTGTHLEDHETHWVRNDGNPYIVLNGDNTASVVGETHYWWNSVQSTDQAIQEDVKVNTTTGRNYYGLILRENGCGGGCRNEDVYLEINSDLSGMIYNMTHSVTHTFPAGYFTEGQWYTFKATYGNNDIVSAYIDGVLIEQWTSVFTTYPSGSFGLNVMNGSIRNLSYGGTEVQQLTSLAPVNVYISRPLLSAGLRVDVKVDAYKDSTLVASGTVNSVNPSLFGSLQTIPFSTFSPVLFPSGSALKLQVSARNACSGSLRNIGTADLHYNGHTLDSTFGATIDSTSTVYHLRSGFALSPTAGSADQTESISAGAKCSAYKSFGTWTITL